MNSIIQDEKEKLIAKVKRLIPQHQENFRTEYEAWRSELIKELDKLLYNKKGK